jgi:hypothetical protein
MSRFWFRYWVTYDPDGCVSKNDGMGGESNPSSEASGNWALLKLPVMKAQ